MRFSGAACTGGDWSSAQVALITLNPSLAFRLRFHYRDHLGSSTVSRAYTPEYQTGIAGAATFSLKMSALGNQFVTLYAQPEKLRGQSFFLAGIKTLTEFLGPSKSLFDSLE